ncbi:MAG: protein-export membrane protein SecF [Deltaproteobacteria bacterium RIFCSPHIGHO2_12_FULL_43_9]|nr:MAG: protein-export membrane protein SecF [Deltaproteobacteria bacterium RIFCSPHIGHO2_12_FULL_43_9]
MRILKQKTNIDFIGLKSVFYGISAVLIGGSILLLIFKGLNFGVDFTGGTAIQIKTSPDIGISEIRRLATDVGFKNASVQNFGDEPGAFLIRIEQMGATVIGLENRFAEGFKKDFPGKSLVVESVESVGPKVGEELKKQGVLALIFALVAILLYVAVRFDFRYSPGGIVALAHDAVFTLGVVSFLNIEFSLVTLAALLTIIGYSINDTIVIYDRIRENIHKYQGSPISQIVNLSVNETLSRTFLTSFTVLLAVLALFFFGGPVIHAFAVTMLVGVIAGTYSTLGIATPIFVYLYNKQGKK